MTVVYVSQWRSWPWWITINQTQDFTWISPVFPLFSFLFQDPIQDILLGLIVRRNWGRFLVFLCFSWPYPLRDFVECPSTCVCLIVLSWRDKIMDFWEYCTGEVPFLFHLSEVPDSDFISTVEVDLGPSPQVLSASSLLFNLHLLQPTNHTITPSSHSGHRIIPFLDMTLIGLSGKYLREFYTTTKTAKCYSLSRDA